MVMTGPVLVILSLFYFALLRGAFCNTGAVLSPASEESHAPKDQCHASKEEDIVLCEAAKIKQESIQAVIGNDETSGTGSEAPPVSRDVWEAAYNQWILGKETKREPKALNRGLHEAKKRFSEAQASKKDEKEFTMPELEDDELTVIAIAVRNISDTKAEAKDVSFALNTIEDLCSSGDNGRQLQATGGVPHLLRIARSSSLDLSLLSIRTLATCAQNNPVVFNNAVDEGAVEFMLGLTSKSSDAIRAASLRALVAITDSEKAIERLRGEKDKVVDIVKESLKTNLSSDGRRCQIRALALAEKCLLEDGNIWKPLFQESGLVQITQVVLKSEDLDIRESAAKVLSMLR